MENVGAVKEMCKIEENLETHGRTKWNESQTR